MKKVLLAALLMLGMGVAKAEGTGELSNLNARTHATFAKEVVNGKITWNVHYEIRESDYIDVEEYLTKIGQFLKEHRECKISVKSYADKGTGNPTVNMEYSRQRNLKAVAALVAAGVDKSLITAEYFGDTVQPFAENDKNRVTIITATGLKDIETEEPTKAEVVTSTTDDTSSVNTNDVAEVIVEDSVVEEELKGKFETFFTPKNKKAVSRKGHWFIGANFGGQGYIGDHNRQTKTKDIFNTLVTPAADIYVGYWFNRFLGARLDIGGFNIKGLCYNQDSQANTGKDSPFAHPTDTYVCRTGETLNKQRFNYINAHADVLINMMQVTRHGHDFFDLIPYVGYGWNFAWSPYDYKKNTNAWNFDMGIIFGFRITKHWSINVDARGLLLPDRFDGDGHNNGNTGKDRNNKFEGIPSLNLGASYTF